MNNISFLILVLFAAFICGQEHCTTPDGKEGVYKSILLCPGLKEKAFSLQYNTAPAHLVSAITTELLKSRRDDSSWTVCCNDCTTPDRKNGTIMSIRQCSHLWNSLMKQTESEFIAASRIDQNTLNVCCGPDETVTRKPDVCDSQIDYPPDPSTKCCGIDLYAGDRIVGGSITNIEEYPWLVLLEYKIKGKMRTECGGSLISNKIVVTAAHCLAVVPVNVILGEFDTDNPGRDCQDLPEGEGQECNDGAVSIPLEAYVVHEDFKWRNNDIALIRLKQTVQYTDYIRPICLPSTDFSLKKINFYVAGWGMVDNITPKSRYKRSVKLPLKSCEYTQWNRRASQPHVICAGGERGKDSCRGDSGGPLMGEPEAGDRFELAGVVSYGPTPCGTEGKPSVNTNVYDYLDWIHENLREETKWIRV